MSHIEQDAPTQRHIMVPAALMCTASIIAAVITLEIRSTGLGRLDSVRSCDVVPDKPWWQWAGCKKPGLLDEVLPLWGIASKFPANTPTVSSRETPEEAPTNRAALDQADEILATGTPTPNPSSAARSVVFATLPMPPAIEPATISKTLAEAALHSQSEHAAGAAAIWSDASTRLNLPDVPEPDGLVVLEEASARLRLLGEPTNVPVVPDAGEVLALACTISGCGPFTDASEIDLAATEIPIVVSLPPDAPEPDIPLVLAPMPPSRPSSRPPAGAHKAETSRPVPRGSAPQAAPARWKKEEDRASRWAATGRSRGAKSRRDSVQLDGLAAAHAITAGPARTRTSDPVAGLLSGLARTFGLDNPARATRAREPDGGLMGQFGTRIGRVDRDHAVRPVDASPIEGMSVGRGEARGRGSNASDWGNGNSRGGLGDAIGGALGGSGNGGGRGGDHGSSRGGSGISADVGTGAGAIGGNHADVGRGAGLGAVGGAIGADVSSGLGSGGGVGNSIR